MPLGFRNWFSSRRRMRSDDSINETFHNHGQHVAQRDILTADDRLSSIREVDEAIDHAMRTPRRPHPFGGITVTTTTTVQRFDAQILARCQSILTSLVECRDLCLQACHGDPDLLNVPELWTPGLVEQDFGLNPAYYNMLKAIEVQLDLNRDMFLAQCESPFTTGELDLSGRKARKAARLCKTRRNSL
ncbi:hypothetical protein E8E14_009294 [Neopestalotiopsis sp. 37M]|nr:hypothetical protein E8E14_009294 [Neopestalotiopsis sp. 37M]